MLRTLPLCAAAILAGTVATAEDDLDAPGKILTARHGYMLLMAQELAPLGAMARGEMTYDATTATRAAKSLAALASVDTSMLWVPGTETDVLADSDALPEIMTDATDRTSRFDRLRAAADGMVTAAGVDAISIRNAMVTVGAACGGCHKQYRRDD